MADSFATMRGLHILFAVLWAGASLFWGTVVNKLGQKDPAVIRSFTLNAFHGPFLGLTSLLALVFGMGAFFSAPDGSYAGTQQTILVIGMVAGSIGVLVGWGGHLPTMIGMKKALEVGDEAVYAAGLRREHLLDKISLVVVVLAIVTMSTFRLF
ncbi:MAG: hypothetical protein ACPHK8_02570 [Thermoplasmatota archaeon]